MNIPYTPIMYLGLKLATAFFNVKHYLKRLTIFLILDRVFYIPPIGIYLYGAQIMPSYFNDKKEILVRLRKLEGQLKGIQRMVAAEKYCVDVLNQLSAVVAATQRVASIILKDHIQGCIRDALIRDERSDELMNELFTVIERFTSKK